MRLKTSANNIVIIIILTGIAARLFFVFSSPENLITIVPDDAFYYFKIAKNICLGLGSSFDGINPTNGYHPLWMIILLPLAKLITAPWVMIKTTLFLAVIFNTATAVLLNRFLKEKTQNSLVANIGLVLYFLNYRVIANSLNGLETSLASFLLMVLIFLVLGRNFNFVKPKNFAILGTIFGMAFLARTDLIFYLLPLFLIVISRAKNNHFKNGVLFSITSFITISPWIFWNLAKFNTILQSSANAVPFVLKQYLLTSSQHQGIILRNSITLLGKFFINDFFSILGFPCFFVILTLIFLLRLTAQCRRKITPIFSLFLGGIFLTFIHVSIRQYPRPWYFDQLILIGSIIISYIFFLFLSLKKDSKNILKRFTVLVIFLVAIFNLNKIIYLNEYPHQIEMLKAGEWLNRNTDEKEISASFNCGIIGYFSDRSVINLDGVVNNKAYKAIKEYRLWEFINQSEAKYFIDYDPFMMTLYQPFMGKQFLGKNLLLVKEIDEPGVEWEKSSIKIFEINRKEL